MNLPFLNRVAEQERLQRVLRAPDPSLAVVYGRRRCGKSTLLQQVAKEGDVYFLADQRETPLQIQAFAETLDRQFKGFSAGTYGSWDRLLRALVSRADTRINVILDEFPYLVRSAPELPSLLQRMLDEPGPKHIAWVLCGSSQRMMQGAVLDRTAPLYGRAREILRLRPLRAGWCAEALGLDGPKAVEAYAIWGGVPRYWELALPYPCTEAAFAALGLDRDGVLHEEPERLLIDEMRNATQAASLLSLIGGGCHRLSEIAGRSEKPAGSLTRPLSNLIELGYVRRETPWGESPRGGKRTIYAVADPYLRFHYRFVVPNLSLLESGHVDAVRADVARAMTGHVAGIWEELARESVPFLGLHGREWGAASRWWGVGTDGRRMEIDVVAESLDREAILVGEAKWTQDSVAADVLMASLMDRAQHLPGLAGRTLVGALWLRVRPSGSSNVCLVSPDDVLRVLR